MKRTRFQDYLIEVSQSSTRRLPGSNISKGRQAHPARRSRVNSSLQPNRLRPQDAALAEAFRLIKGGDVAVMRIRKGRLEWRLPRLGYGGLPGAAPTHLQTGAPAFSGVLLNDDVAALKQASGALPLATRLVGKA